MSAELTKEQEMHVQKQMIEAVYVDMSKLLKIMKEHFGEEAYHVAVKAHGNKIREHMRKKALEIGGDSIESMLKCIQSGMREQGFEFTNEEIDSGILVKHTRCPIYDMAKRNEITEQVFYLCCEGDQFIPEGFNPNIGFKRTKTLMHGHDCCDSFYYYKNESK